MKKIEIDALLKYTKRVLAEQKGGLSHMKMETSPV